ncbi:MAG: LamG-like jellyroll fold domain-containing protein [Patescibacteria group bacterium]
MKVKISIKILFISGLIGGALMPSFCLAMSPGTLLFRTSQDAKMYGYSADPLIYAEKGIVKNIYSGHVGVYIGRENGVDYIVEAMGGGIVKTPAKYFVNRAEGETFLGARLPRGVTHSQQAKVVALAKSLVSHSLAYDFDFKHQKGPGSGEWTCVGLTEKLYESANISNPNNLASLEYEPAYYAINITPDGFDNKSVVNAAGDCFSRNQEFSKIARRRDLIIPAPELLGFDVGLEYQGDRYVFLPYTQFLQPSLDSVPTDITIASSFSGNEIRGPINTKMLVLRWSLVNNPISSFKIIVGGFKDLSSALLIKSKELANNLSQKFFNSDKSDVVLLSDEENEKNVAWSDSLAKSPTATTSPRIALVNKAEPGKNIVSPVSQTIKATTTPVASVKISTSTVKVRPIVKNQAASTTKIISSSAAASSSASQASSSILHRSNSSPSSVSNSIGQNKVNTNLNISTSAATSLEQPNNLALINKIYSTADNYWVELYNPTDHDFDLAAAGYRLEKTKTAADPSLIIRIGNSSDASYPGGTIIKAHGKYLIVASDAKDFYRNKADALVSRNDFSWTGSGYTLYLGNGAISSSIDSNIIEAVGFGSQANYFEGTGPAPEIKDNYILNRIATSGNNNSDFNLIASDDPEVIIAASIISANNTATSSNNIASTSPAASTSPIIISTSSTSSLATSTDNNPDDENASTTEIVDWRKLALISKIYSTGNNDWIELFNASNQDLDLALAEYRLEKSKTATDPSLLLRFNNTEDALYPGGTIIKANSSYLIVRDDASSYYKSQADAIALRDEFSWTGSGYTVYLGNGAISSGTDSNIIDLVGFGSEASRFQGAAPALSINDNYILNRIATSGNNNLDFNLIPSDDPEIASSSSAIDTSFLFSPPVPVESAGLTDLWHFDECYGAGNWGVGFFDCAREIGFTYDKLVGSLHQAADLNNFSVSFYYRRSYDYPRLNLRFYNSLDTQFILTMEPDYITITGLPESRERYYMTVPFDNEWHQATLVINQASDYWALYIDGQEMIMTSFLARLSLMTDFEVSGNCGSVLFDELAFWNRPLPMAEIYSYYAIAVPFSPIVARPPQKIAALVNLWKFEEDTGTVARDSLEGLEFNMPQAIWTGRHHDNYAIQTIYGQNFTAAFKEPIKSQDLSLAFWWRNSAYPNGGRADIYLRGGTNNETNLFSLLMDYYRLGFWFNGSQNVLSEGINEFIPYDNLWHHLALVYDSYRYKLSFYVDGQERASTALVWIKPSEEIKSLKITSSSDGSEIDDLSIYTGALSPVQIEDIYLNTK